MKILARAALYAGLGLAALTFIYPFLWMVSSTLKPPLEVGTLAGFSLGALPLHHCRISCTDRPCAFGIQPWIVLSSRTSRF